eukprot:TRINITY_DN46248_c0_g1_i1.p1 TRINITY_DN46248_c0_g1~~TRINITY_DN46248_c0_g1_i1.p1  ORF type:complete len:429 (+),score=154.58 TRINITY_DN46248_c0_g1_i1:129-1415(+)
MAAKSGFSFGFAKKAEPKRVVEALKKEKPKEERVAILGVEEGAVTVDGVVEEAKKPTIACKNPLSAHREVSEAQAKARAEAKAKAAAKPDAAAKSLKDMADDLPGGLVKNVSKLSEEDAEAMRELLKDASATPGSGADASGPSAAGLAIPVKKPQPILMGDGSKRARSGALDRDASKDQFDRMPVEGFGEALLRGMGFNPEKHSTKYVYHEKPRENLLGLGATALLPHEKLGLKAPQKQKAAAAAAAAEAAAKAEDGEADGKAETPAEPAKPAPKGASAVLAAMAATASASSSSKAGEPQEKKRKVTEMWASRGLVVRVIGKEGQLKSFFGAEAVVTKVDEASSTFSIKARPPSDPNAKSTTLPGVRIEEIETRVSRDCTEVRILRGRDRGKVAKLRKRDTKLGVAVVSIEGNADSELPLDDVCQFIG